MSGSIQRVDDAFAFRAPDRTPATDAGLYWDALAEGITGDELLELSVDAQYRINRYFEVDMVRFNGAPGPNYRRPDAALDRYAEGAGVRPHAAAATSCT